MRISRWLLERYKRLDRRERIVVAAGAVISVVALSVAYLLLPFARNWTEREEAIEAKMEQVARLQALLENREALQEAVDGLEQSRDRRARRLLTGSTAALAASSVQSLMRSYAERSRVRLERVTVDPDQIEQVFMNILINARQSMPDGGAITVRTAKVTDNGCQKVRVDIVDEGLGMTEETREKALKPFYTTKHRGTGLGLSIVQRIVEAHRASISIDSELGEGTTFSILFPA